MFRGYYVMCWLVFFFFQQKSAYELRISDWSSDVCSSDLYEPINLSHRAWVQPPPCPPRRAGCGCSRRRPCDGEKGHEAEASFRHPSYARARPGGAGFRECRGAGEIAPRPARTAAQAEEDRARSEEHTSELQSLMRISYAVFCLKKKHKKISDKITV